MSELTEFDIQVLKEIVGCKKENGWIAPEFIALAFSNDDEEYEEMVQQSALKLLKLKLIKGCGDPDADGSHGAYSITPPGKDFLKSCNKSSSAKISHISNSQIVIGSTNVIQRLEITDPEILERIQELEQAIKKKDPSLIQKAFLFILDKSVDAAVAILINGMK